MSWLLTLILAMLSAVTGQVTVPVTGPAPACRADHLDARHSENGAATAGTYFLIVALTNQGPDCALTTGGLELSANGVEVATLDLADWQDAVVLPSGGRYRLRASVPNVDCFAAGAHAAVLALSDAGADGPGQVVAGGAVPDSYVTCAGVRLSGADRRAAPSR